LQDGAIPGFVRRVPTEQQPTKVREIDKMLQEMKQNVLANTYDIDHPDVTTNLFVSNIDPSMNEDTLKSIFDRFGKVTRYVHPCLILLHLLTCSLIQRENYVAKK
jgi:RNA recognition motif-containing protein